MQLKNETRQWTDRETGEIKVYNVYYVEVNGIKIYLKPQDSTGRQLLDMFLKK